MTKTLARSSLPARHHTAVCSFIPQPRLITVVQVARHLQYVSTHSAVGKRSAVSLNFQQAPKTFLLAGLVSLIAKNHRDVAIVC